MTSPNLPNILETPNHFWFGATDLAFTTNEPAKIKKLGNGMVAVTKTFICQNYKYCEKDSIYYFRKPTELGKQ